jgi:hypothetical protein
MKGVSIKLEKEKKIYDESYGLLGSVQNTKNGTEILISDSKEEYNKQYYYNYELIGGIIIIGLLLTSMFKKKS